MAGVDGIRLTIPAPIEASRELQSARRLLSRRSSAAGESGRTKVRGSSGSRDAELERMRTVVDKVVGLTFYGTLLRAQRSASLRGSIGHGGRGEEIFGAQLDQVLAERAGVASGFNLSEVIVRRLSGQVGAGAANSRSGTGGES